MWGIFVLLPLIAGFVAGGVASINKNVPIFASIFFVLAGIATIFFIVGFVIFLKKIIIEKKGFETTATIETIYNSFAGKYEQNEVSNIRNNGGYFLKLKYKDEKGEDRSVKLSKVFTGKQTEYLKQLPEIKVKCKGETVYIVEDYSSVK